MATFRIEVTRAGSSSESYDFTEEDVALYLQLTDALRILEIVTVRHFLTAKSGMELGQKGWLSQEIAARIHSIYTEVLADPATGQTNCSPFCDDGHGGCIQC